MIKYIIYEGGIHMRKKDKEAIISLILLIGIIFHFQGLNGVIEFIKNIGISFWSVLKMLNQITVQMTDDTVLALMFSSSITFVLVGIVLEIFNIPRGKFGKIFGKISFWLIGFPVSFVLNIIGRLILQ